jgi:hypothetical protein
LQEVACKKLLARARLQELACKNSFEHSPNCTCCNFGHLRFSTNFFRHDLHQLNSLEDTYNVDEGFSYRKKRSAITIVETPALDEILKAHIVPGYVDTADIHDEDVLETINNHDIRMTVYNTYPQRYKT